MLTRHAAVELLAGVNIELATAPPDVEAILTLATSRLSRVRPATWVAVVMNPNPETSRFVVADDRDRELARYIHDYVAALDAPHQVPTVGLSQQVIESGDPIVIPRVSFEDFLARLSPAGEEHCRNNPPPGDVRWVALLIVPMRVAGATLGTLAMLDARDRHLVDAADVAWIQLVADRIALSVEHARLLATARVHAGEMEILRAIAFANHEVGDLQMKLASTVDRITVLRDVDAADILLFDGSGNELVMAASAGYRSPCPSGHRFDARWAGVESWPRRPEISQRSDLDRQGRNPRRSQFARESFQTVVTVPLQGPSRTIGMLNLYSREVVEWEQSRLEFLDTLGSLVATTIDHATHATGAGASQTIARPDISDLEVDILRLIAEGFTNREIGAQVYRSENTVKFHVRRILERTNASNRTELVRLALRAGWL